MGKQGTESNQNAPSSGGLNHAHDIGLLVEALTPLPKRGRDSPLIRRLNALPGTPEAVDAAVDMLTARLIPDLNRHLKSLEGMNFGPEDNAEFARSLSRLLRRLHSWGLECPHCLHPAISLRYTWSGSALTPVFKYEHSGGNRHGGTVCLASLKLIRHFEKRDGK